MSVKRRIRDELEFALAILLERFIFVFLHGLALFLLVKFFGPFVRWFVGI
jgi:hypothetical protein